MLCQLFAFLKNYVGFVCPAGTAFLPLALRFTELLFRGAASSVPEVKDAILASRSPRREVDAVRRAEFQLIPDWEASTGHPRPCVIFIRLMAPGG